MKEPGGPFQRCLATCARERAAREAEEKEDGKEEKAKEEEEEDGKVSKNRTSHKLGGKKSPVDILHLSLTCPTMISSYHAATSCHTNCTTRMKEMSLPRNLGNE